VIVDSPPGELFIGVPPASDCQFDSEGATKLGSVDDPMQRLDSLFCFRPGPYRTKAQGAHDYLRILNAHAVTSRIFVLGVYESVSAKLGCIRKSNKKLSLAAIHRILPKKNDNSFRANRRNLNDLPKYCNYLSG
jgi:hypothetical protein